MNRTKEMDLTGYSLTRALRCQLTGQKLDGLEAEADQEFAKTMPEKTDGVCVPHSILYGRGRRDLQAGVFTQGGAMVATEIPDEVVPLLRNRSVCLRLGARRIGGLSGNVAIPRETSPTTPQAVSELAALDSSTPTVDQISLTPHRAGIYSVLRRQLILQSSVDVERFLREDMLASLGIKFDYFMLQGSGANDEPLGVMNVPGIGSVTFNGAATWDKVIAFETALAQMNALLGKPGYVTTPAVRARWKTILKIPTGTVPIFLWEDLPTMDDVALDGRVNGYRASATNQILNNTMVFGNWEDLVLASWGNSDSILVNPYSLDTEGAARVTINTYIDVAVRHAQSFCWSADSGAQ